MYVSTGAFIQNGLTWTVKDNEDERKLDSELTGAVVQLISMILRDCVRDS